MPDPSGIFQADFLTALRTLIGTHHSIYGRVPPQGIYFEALVEKAFRIAKKPFTPIRPTGRNQPTHDLLVEDKRISLKRLLKKSCCCPLPYGRGSASGCKHTVPFLSRARQQAVLGLFQQPLKTETGAGTDSDLISITKLCTTEREPWTPDVLIQRVLAHLGRYDIILMLRAVWERPLIRYQLLEIPVETLGLIRTANLQTVGKRTGRQSLGADVYREATPIFHVHFDGSDGKCQVRNLRVEDCALLLAWDWLVTD